MLGTIRKPRRPDQGGGAYESLARDYFFSAVLSVFFGADFLWCFFALVVVAVEAAGFSCVYAGPYFAVLALNDTGLPVQRGAVAYAPAFAALG